MHSRELRWSERRGNSILATLARNREPSRLPLLLRSPDVSVAMLSESDDIAKRPQVIALHVARWFRAGNASGDCRCATARGAMDSVIPAGPTASGYTTESLLYRFGQIDSVTETRGCRTWQRVGLLRRPPPDPTDGSRWLYPPPTPFPIEAVLLRTASPCLPVCAFPTAEAIVQL